MKIFKLDRLILSIIIILFASQANAANDQCAWKKETSLSPADFHAFVSYFKKKKKYNNLTDLLEHELLLMETRAKESKDEYAELETRLYIMDDLTEVYTYGLVDFTKASELNSLTNKLYKKIEAKGLLELPVSSYFNNYRFLFYTFYPGGSFLNKSKMDFVFPDKFINSIRETDFNKLGKRIKSRTDFIQQKLGRPILAKPHYENSNKLNFALFKSYVNLIDFSPEYSILEREYLKAQAASPILLSSQEDNELLINAIIQTNSTALRTNSQPSKEELIRYCQMNYWLVLALLEDQKPRQALIHHKQLMTLIDQLDEQILFDYKEAERLLRDYYSNKLQETNKTRQTTKSFLSGLAKAGVIIAKVGLVIAGAAGDIAISSQGHTSTSLTETALDISLSGDELDWGAGDAVLNSQVLSPLDKLDEDNPEQLKKAMSPYALKLNRFLNKYEMINYLSAVGDAYAHSGLNKQAYRQYDEAIKIVEKQRITIQSETEKVNFFGLKERLYGKTVQVLVELKQLDRAFEYIERSKSRAFLDIIAGNDIKLKDRAQNALSNGYAKNNLALDSILESGLQSNDQLELITTNFRGIKKLSSNVNKETAKEIYSLSNVNSINIEQAKDLIEPGTAILEYYLNGNKLTILTIKNSGLTCTVKEIDYKELCREIAKFKTAILKKQYGNKHARNLYNILIEPIGREISKCKRLIIVPHKVLHYLPFHALKSRQGYLVLKHSISYSPSTTVLSIVENKIGNNNGKALIIGNPTKNLPFAEKEALSIGKILTNSTICIGNNGTETIIKEKSDEYNVIHIATHGSFNGKDPMNSELYLSPDQKNDGTLRATELFGCDWHASLVTLSACETGISKYNRGDELIGLQRAVFFAGTKSLLASSWKVDDKSTSYQMRKFYKYLKKYPKDQALQKAQVDTLIEYGRPYHWASFKLIGSPRRAINPEYRVRINTTPHDAKIKIYGTPKRNTPYLRLPTGKYTVNVSHKGYETQNATLKISHDKTIHIRLKRAKKKEQKKKGKTTNTAQFQIKTGEEHQLFAYLLFI
ncbi:CHAT domain-containing protein [Maridesulfovibrio sp.]|uniref:CHAT domain-containing protein n=1 Tax=Maridesulfovibrio sp. TaxID=2795000 RepID=UPI002A18A287|nr:CHAT domain-containing protein [Maridesulfovibrio sp.]